MKFINLTPHAIHINNLIIPSSGIVRIDIHETESQPIEGIPITKTSTGTLTGLPKPKLNNLYITSGIVAQEAINNGRNDIYSPHGLIRDSQGKIIGCKGLAQPRPSTQTKLLTQANETITRLQNEYNGIR